MTDKHTPTPNPVPWAVDDDGNVVVASDGETVCTNGRGGNVPAWTDQGRANMRMLVHRVNAHDALVAALKKIAYEPIGHSEASYKEVMDDITQIARAALSRAEEAGK